MLIALLNYSSLVTSAQSSVMAAAVQRQIRFHAAPAWAMNPATVVFYADPKAVPAYALPIGLFDHADQAGALGYHTEDPNGRKYGKVFVQDTLQGGGGKVLTGAFSVASVFSHEALEAWGDAPCNRWADAPDSNSYAWELCDPVESDWYPIGLYGEEVSVSNFVLPDWFDETPLPGSHFDYMHKLTAPFSMTSGGYVVYRSYGQEQQSFGRVVTKFGDEYPEWKKPGKSHRASRSNRRGAFPKAA